MWTKHKRIGPYDMGIDYDKKEWGIGFDFFIGTRAWYSFLGVRIGPLQMFIGVANESL